MLQFVPWVWDMPDSEPADGTLYATLKQRFEQYKQHLVQGFYEQHFAGFDRQIVLVDCLQPLNAGAASFGDMQQAIARIMESFAYGKSNWWRRLFSPRIDKLLFVASKADHVTPEQHAPMVSLLQHLVRSGRGQARFEGITTECLALAAIKATEVGKGVANGREFPAIRGTSLSGESLLLFPGEVPPHIPPAQWWNSQGFDFQAFRPMPMSAHQALPISGSMRRWSFCSGITSNNGVRLGVVSCAAHRRLFSGEQGDERSDKEGPLLQGKVILEPALTVASDERPPAPAQRLEEASFERLDELDEFTEVESTLVIKPRRRHRLLAWGLGAVGLLSLGQYGAFLYEQFLTTPLWGSAWLAASALVAAGTASVVGREWLRLRTLKRRQDVRSRAEDLLVHQGVGQGQAFCEGLAVKSGDKGREGYQTWLAQLDESHSDREVLTLYSQLVLSERDKLAQTRVAKWSGEAAVLVALSPLATVDMMLMLWRNLRMIEDIADVYAIELGYWSRIRLIRQVFRNMLYAGATELVTEVGMDLLGAELTAKLSARAAQGVGAGLLTARLGLRTIEACRPLPWCADEKPKLGELRKRLIGQLAGYLNKS